jgi:hypothetical protein
MLDVLSPVHAGETFVDKIYTGKIFCQPMFCTVQPDLLGSKFVDECSSRRGVLGQTRSLSTNVFEARAAILIKNYYKIVCKKIWITLQTILSLWFIKNIYHEPIQREGTKDP